MNNLLKISKMPNRFAEESMLLKSLLILQSIFVQQMCTFIKIIPISCSDKLYQFDKRFYISLRYRSMDSGNINKINLKITWGNQIKPNKYLIELHQNGFRTLQDLCKRHIQKEKKNRFFMLSCQITLKQITSLRELSEAAKLFKQNHPHKNTIVILGQAFQNEVDFKKKREQLRVQASKASKQQSGMISYNYSSSQSSVVELGKRQSENGILGEDLGISEIKHKQESKYISVSQTQRQINQLINSKQTEQSLRQTPSQRRPLMENQYEGQLSIAKQIQCHFCSQISFRGPIYQCTRTFCRDPCGKCVDCNKQATKKKCRYKVFIRLCSKCQYKHSHHSLIKIISTQQLEFQDRVIKPSKLQLPKYNQNLFSAKRLVISQGKLKQAERFNINSNLENNNDRSNMNSMSFQSQHQSSSYQNNRSTYLTHTLISKYQLSPADVQKYKKIMRMYDISQDKIQPYLEPSYNKMSLKELKQVISNNIDD